MHTIHCPYPVYVFLLVSSAILVCVWWHFGGASNDRFDSVCLEGPAVVSSLLDEEFAVYSTQDILPLYVITVDVDRRASPNEPALVAAFLRYLAR